MDECCERSRNAMAGCRSEALGAWCRRNGSKGWSDSLHLLWRNDYRDRSLAGRSSSHHRWTSYNARLQSALLFYVNGVSYYKRSSQPGIVRSAN